jgi:hypothetical protein
MPTSRRQNIMTKPATAANTEARGINVSGPMYKRRLLGCLRGPRTVPTHDGLQSDPVVTTLRQRYCVCLA